MNNMAVPGARIVTVGVGVASRYKNEPGIILGTFGYLATVQLDTNNAVLILCPSEFTFEAVNQDA